MCHDVGWHVECRGALLAAKAFRSTTRIRRAADDEGSELWFIGLIEI